MKSTVVTDVENLCKGGRYFLKITDDYEGGMFFPPGRQVVVVKSTGDDVHDIAIMLHEKGHAESYSNGEAPGDSYHPSDPCADPWAIARKNSFDHEAKYKEEERAWRYARRNFNLVVDPTNEELNRFDAYRDRCLENYRNGLHIKLSDL